MELSLNSGWSNKVQGGGVINNTSSTGLSVSDMIKQEEAAEKESSKSKLSDYFNKRSSLRRSISSGELSSGNKAQDVYEARVGKLVDLYLDAASKEVDENGKPVFSTEKIIEESKNPNKVIADMKRYYMYHSPKKAWAIDDYIQKGGIATNVYEYLEDVGGNVTNPYGKVDVVGNLFDEDTTSLEKAVVPATTFVPSLGANLAGRIGSIEWLDNLLYNQQYKIWDTANDEEYKQYKSGTLPKDNTVSNVNMLGESKQKFYDDYTKAQEEGFIGSVDEYKNFKKNMHKIANEAISNRLKEGVLTEEDIDTSKLAIASDALGEFVTYMTMPFKKLFKIEGVGPLVNRIANVTVDSLINTAELGGIEALKDNSPDAWDMTKMEGVNLLISAITHSPQVAKYLNKVNQSKTNRKIADLIAKVPERVRNAYERLSAEQLTTIKNLTKNATTQSSLKKANQGIKYFGQKGIDAVDTSFNKYLEAGAKLGKEGQNLKNSGITKELFENKMNDALSQLEDTQFMGNTKRGKGQSPKVHIVETSAGPELKIENRENLNMIKNGQGKGLADAMEDIFYGMFGKGGNRAGAGMELNEATLLAFTNELKGATKGTEWSWGNMGAKTFGDGLDAFRSEANLPQSFLDAEADYFNKKDLYNKLSDAFGNYGKYSSEVDKEVKLFEAGKKLQDKNLQGVLEMAQDAGYISDTVDAEIIAYGYMLALQDEAAARAFFGGIYPSEPGFIEAILEAIRNGIREGTIDRYINAKTLESARKQGVGGMAELSDTRRYINKSLGGGANIVRNRLSESEQDPYGDIDMEAFQEWQKSKK